MTQDNIPPEVLKNVANFTMNVAVARVDELVQSAQPDPLMQCAVLMLAQALVFRRIASQNKMNHVAKRRLLRGLLQDFDRKIREFGFSDGSQLRQTDSK